jgi:oligopeptide transport system ATP-binding protein
VQAQIINLLMDLKKRLSLTFLIITHDLALVEHMADAVGVMYLGRFVEQGSVANVCGAPRHPYTQSLMAAASHGGGSLLDDRPVLLLEGSIPSPLAVPPGCSFHTRCPRARLIASRDLSSTVETPDGRVPRRCAEDEPVPDPAPNGASIAACHFAGEHQFTSSSLPGTRR